MKFTVSWIVDDTSVETDTDVGYNSKPSYDGNTPTSKKEPTFIFEGWMKDGVLIDISNEFITGDVCYIALFKEATT